jgi:hypothetical protein
VFLFHPRATPGSLLLALTVAGLATLLTDVAARLVAGPLIDRWLRPRADASEGLFRLAATERVLDSTPARRKMGRSWPAGTLVRTNLRLWFFPASWTAEPWASPAGGLCEVGLVPAPRLAWGLLRGLPDRVLIPSEQGPGEVFAVADPRSVLSWLGTTAHRPTPVSTR